MIIGALVTILFVSIACLPPMVENFFSQEELNQMGVSVEPDSIMPSSCMR